MDVEDVRNRLATIAGEAGDPEIAHSEQDRLDFAVLSAIAQGSPNAVELATEALKADEIDFPRWCA